MGFRYQLRDSAGDDLGESEYSYQPQAGDTIHFDGNRRAIVHAVVPAAKISEFVDRPVYGLLEVEPL